MSKENMPEWAKNLEDWGKSMESWGEDFGKKFSKEETQVKEEKKPKWKRKNEFVGEIIGNLIILLIINNAPKYFPDFFASSYPAVLWVMNVVLIITIVGNILLLLFSPKYIYYLFRALFAGLSTISLITIITLFPINVPVGLELIFKFALSIAAVVTAIMAVVFFVLGALSIFGDAY